MENTDVQITYSEGRGKAGRRYAFIRPLFKCQNKSHRVIADRNKIQEFIEKNFPNVNYYKVDGLVIGAKSEQFAMKEFWRICEKSKIGKIPAIQILKEYGKYC
jgi:hypothetical protein